MIRADGKVETTVLPEKKITKNAVTEAEVTVGARVRVRRSAESAAAGEVVEDYAELTDSSERGHDRPPVHRWAIALDDGRLIFADGTDLTLESHGAPIRQE
jgi:hypothetical protein